MKNPRALLRRSVAIAVAAVACAGPPSQISQSDSGAYEAALATREDGLIAAWHDTRDGNAEIYVRALDAEGRPVAPERRLTNGPEESYEASIDMAGAVMALAWYDKSADGLLTPKLGVWDVDGRNRWVRTLAEAGRNPVVSAHGDDIFCAWIGPGPDGQEWVWAGWWTADGRQQWPTQRLAPAGKTTWNLNALAGESGRAWVVFDATAGTKTDEIFLVRFQPDATSVVRLTADDGRASKYPDIAAAGRFAITWFDERDGNKEVYLLTAAETELMGDVDRRARRVTSTPGESIGAYLRWSDDASRVGLAWSDDSEGQHEIYFQTFDATGQPLGPAQRVTRNGTSSLIPAIRPWRGGFALAWNEFTPGPEGHSGKSEIAFAIVGAAR